LIDDPQAKAINGHQDAVAARKAMQQAAKSRAAYVHVALAVP
jgi:hypothetical protein